MTHDDSVNVVTMGIPICICATSPIPSHILLFQDHAPPPPPLLCVLIMLAMWEVMTQVAATCVIVVVTILVESHRQPHKLI